MTMCHYHPNFIPIELFLLYAILRIWYHIQLSCLLEGHMWLWRGNLKLFWMGSLFLHPHFYICSFIYLYLCGLMDICFTFWFKNQYYFIYFAAQLGSFGHWGFFAGLNLQFPSNKWGWSLSICIFLIVYLCWYSDCSDLLPTF